MGCLFTSPYSPFFYLFSKPAASNAEPKEEAPKVYSWDIRAKIDPKDYSIENKNGETIIKMPGSIDGMQFIIQNLENCNVYLLDYVAQLSIDDCKNCNIFLGPSKASVFIRECSDCNLAIICQQFRTRDCKRINTFLLCNTQPIIESSSSMKFGCVSVNYNGLTDHLKKAKISPFNNNWNNIYDFSPISGESNYTFLNKDQNQDKYIPLPTDETFLSTHSNLTFELKDTIIPRTAGISNRPTDESCLIVIFSKDSSELAAATQEYQANSVINEMRNNHPDVVLVQTKKYKLSELSAENVFGTKNYNNLLEKGEIIGIEYNGALSSQICKGTIQALKIEPVFVSQSSDNLQHQIDNFYNFAEMQMSV